MNHFKQFVSDRYKDNLTGLYQREVIVRYVERLIEEGVPFSYGIIDVDNFKQINDTYGHHVGDIVLQDVAKQLVGDMDDNGVIGRFGGDEFIVVFEGLTDYDAQWQKCYNILTNVDPVRYDEKEDGIIITYTMGMAKYPFDAKTANDIFELADKALYRGKMKGRNCFIIYLESKHKNIDLRSLREKTRSQMYLHLKLHEIISGQGDKATRIKNAIDFVGSELVIDQLMIQNGGAITALYVNPISAKKNALVVDETLLKELTSENGGFFWENALYMSAKKDDLLHKTYEDYGIYSTVVVEIKAFNKSYGYLRADMILKGASRIWQERDLSVLIDLAYKIAFVEYIGEK